jgi:cell division protein FtsB
VPLVKSIQEQQQQIESLKKENAEIRAQLQKLIEIVSKKIN